MISVTHVYQVLKTAIAFNKLSQPTTQIESDASISHPTNPGQTPMNDINLTHLTLISLSHLNHSTSSPLTLTLPLPLPLPLPCTTPHLSEATTQEIEVGRSSEAITISCRELSFCCSLVGGLLMCGSPSHLATGAHRQRLDLESLLTFD
jgi:hypothetical protein